MTQRIYDGGLTLATSRPGLIVRCVKLPSNDFLSLWGKFYTGRAWQFMPISGNQYIIRGNTHGMDTFPERYKRGVLLATLAGKALTNPPVTPASSLQFEPYFPYSCFSLVPQPTIPARVVARTGRR